MAIHLKGRKFTVGAPAAPPAGSSNFTSAQMLSLVKANGATVNDSVFISEIEALPSYIRQNASMISMLPAAYKSGTYYSFDNRPTTGTLFVHSFIRNAQASAMNSDNAIWSYQPNEPVFEYNNSYYAEKQAVIDSINTNPARKLVTSFLPAGYVTDGSVNYTSQFNSALSGGGDVVMPNFPIMINGNANGVVDSQVRSDTRILFQANSQLWVKPYAEHQTSDYSILLLTARSNVTIIDANIRGDKGFGGTGSLSHERGQGIEISGGKNITLYDPKVTDCWGDGIYLVYSGISGDCDNVKIYNPVLANNGRNNISVTNGINILLHEGIYPNANKSNPVSGIDLEPNSPTVGNTKRFTNINIINPITWDNWWSGIQMGMAQRYSATTGDPIQPFDCYVQNHYSDGDCWAHRITLDKAADDITNLYGTLTFLNPELLNPVTYSPPPGGGSATTTTIMQDGDKAVIKYFLDDPNMIVQYLHPKAVLNGNEYDDTELTSLFNSINFQRTTKVIQIP